jgi:hypothetical protein
MKFGRIRVCVARAPHLRVSRPVPPAGTTVVILQRANASDWVDVRRSGAADGSKSALGFRDFGFWQICPGTACSSRACTECDWVAGSGFYHAETICARQTPICELQATCIARLLWPVITS